jgi:KAP family P-loop domain
MATGSTSPVRADEAPSSKAPQDVRQGTPHAFDAAEPPPGEPPAEKVGAYDEELTQLLSVAAWIGQGGAAEPYVSFTSLFLAFLAARGTFSTWVQGKVGWIGPAMEDVIRRWRVRAPEVRGLDVERVRRAGRLTDAELPEAYALSPSANELIERALQLAKDLGDEGALGARHLLAAFVYQLGNLRDLEAWKFDREAWATRLLSFAIDAYPVRAEAWQALHDRHFPRPHAASLATALRWATLRAGEEATRLDATAVLEGILLHGLADAKKASSAWKLVSQIGAGIEALELDSRADAELPAEALPPGPELLPILARARVFATATRIPKAADSEENRCGFLSIRHVVAALLTDSRPLPAFELLRRAGRTEGGVLAQFRQWLCSIGPGNDDCEIWKELFEEHREDVLAGYDNDEAKGEDRLGIDHDVRALAAVLASTKVTPPLSVGLFGDWGSGKSFFMGKLRERIDQLAAAAHARPEAESWFCGKRGAVVQIDFNAWHYMDADLWSSLAVRVFDSLAENLNEQFIQACRENITSLQEREAKLHAEKAQVAEAAAALERLLQEQREARAVREVRLGELAKKLAEEQLKKIKEHPDVAKVNTELKLEGNNVKRELERAQRDLQYIGGRAEMWWRTLGSPARAITLLLVLGAPALAGALVSMYLHAGTTIVAAIAAYGVAFTTLFTRVRGFTTRVAGYVDAAVSEVARIEQAVRDQKSPEELGLEAERDSSSARIAELEREQLALAKRKTELEAELAALEKGDAQTLREFILERAAAQDYRRNLGVISAIHHDFTQLARFLAPSERGPNVERIVLYIDDLDRCPPKRVVEVLQAIHIILSLPLFVVVVGVDSRWLLDSLAAFYREQFPKDAVTLDVARPQQYLEKIFQVPYTLLPMTSEGYSSLVAAMLGAPAPAMARPEPAGGGGASAAAGSGAAGGASGGRTTAARPTRASAQRRRLSGGGSGEAIDLMPQSLRLEPEELAHLQSLARLVPTPRAAKRLVNLYRIVRASLDDDELMQLLGGRYRLLQICLGLVIGYPSFGAELFSQILSGKVSGRPQLQGWLKQRGEQLQDGIDVREIAALSVLHENSNEFQSWALVETTVRRVGRFSFETGRTLALHAALVRSAAAAAAQSE